MLGVREPQSGFFDTDFFCKGRIAEDSFYGFLARYRDRLFTDEQFACLYRLDNGRPSVPPSLLAAVLLLQCHDRVSDQQAWRNARVNLEWTYALGIPPLSEPFAKSTLQLFRAKLILHEQAEAVFQRSLEFAAEEGFLRGRKLSIAVDTTPILGRGAVKDTYNLLADGIRQLIRAFAVRDGVAAARWAEANGLGRYMAGSIKGQADVDWESIDSEREFLWGIVDDANSLLERVRLTASAKHRDRLTAAAALLRDLLQQDVTYDDYGPTIVDGVAKDRIVSVHDPDMRHGRKSQRSRYDGHKGVVAVDVDTQLITAVDVVSPSTYDGDTGLPMTEATEATTGLEVAETVGDTAFGDLQTRDDFDATGRRLVARVPRVPHNGRINKAEFLIDLDKQTCTCPAGQVATDPQPAGFRKNRRGTRIPISAFQFDGTICDDCPLKPQCTRGFGGRTVHVHPREAEVRAARAFQRSDEFKPYRRKRQVAEHRLARLKQLGAGKSRYCGRAKTRFQLLIAAAVANLTLVANMPTRKVGPTTRFFAWRAWIPSMVALRMPATAYRIPVIRSPKWVPS
jgi:transposase